MKAATIPLLRRWVQSSERDWTELPGGQGFYGTGFNHWGVQTQQKYLAAGAVVGTESSVPETERTIALQRAKAALRFNLASHLSGNGTCTDGTRWGHTWISALGVERMMHGVHRLAPHLTDEESTAVSRMLISEADWLLTDYQRGGKPGIHASRWNHEGGNDPESNIWNGCLLWRTAALHPDHPHAADWQERAHCFLINGVSLETDALNEAVIADQPVRERHVGANFFPGYALDHHGYFNVGYMVICVSNAAMLHFDAKLAGFTPPESLYFHQADLWTTLRRLIFGNGRLARIGGDTRIRYAYCQEYLLPSLLLAADRFQDTHAAELIRQQLRLIETEADHSGDGQFFSKRLAKLRERSPYYYTRLESDRAAALGMLVAYEPLSKIPPPPAKQFEESVQGNWTEPEYGAAFHRSPTRLAAFSWRAQGLMQGLCQPPADGHLTEWQHHLGGIVEFLHHATPAGGNEGASHRKLLRSSVQAFPGGFATWGAVAEGIDLSLLEGWRGTDSAIHQMLFVALPDDHTVVGLQHCRTGQAYTQVTRICGLQFNLINDFYNQSRRLLITDAGETSLLSPATQTEVQTISGNWMNLENQVGLVGLYGSESFFITRNSIPGDGAFPSLHLEEIGYPRHDGARLLPPGTLVLDSGWMVLASVNAAGTRACANVFSPSVTFVDEIRVVEISGQNARRYWIAMNFGPISGFVQAPAGLDLGKAESVRSESLKLPPGGCAIRQMD